MIPPLQLLAFAALDYETVTHQRHKLSNILPSVLRSAFPSTPVPGQRNVFRNLATIHNKMARFVRRVACESFVTSDVHAALLNLRSQAAAEHSIVRTIRQLAGMQTLAGRAVLVTMAHPDFYKNLDADDTTYSPMNFLRGPVHRAHMQAIAALAESSFEYDDFLAHMTVRECDVEARLGVLRVEICRIGR
jgi:hypothetical protein